MDIRSNAAAVRGPEDRFTGDVWLTPITTGDTPSRVHSAVVRFAPGARTAWHMHPVGQTIYITEGLCLVQVAQGQVQVFREGDVVRFHGGLWHWHGAGRHTFMSHIAVTDGPEQGAETVWGALVADTDYNQH